MPSFLYPVLLVLAGASASPQVSPSDAKARVDAVFHDYDRSDSPGCALGVYRDGRIVYERGYGMANLELGVANSPQSVFDIASIGKQFTAFAIHLLARDGKLSLDDDIRKWVPEVPGYGKTVTIRHLLHHTGGLRDYIQLMGFQGLKTEDLTTARDALAILELQKAPSFTPGEEYLYSNTGYFLLSVIAQRASGQSLRDFAAARIFGPLGMRHTQYNDLHTRIIPNRATGYSEAEGGGFGIDMSDWEQNGDGGVLTTVEDLQLWDQNFYDPRIGDRPLLEAMQTVGTLNNGTKLNYASALTIGTYRGLRTVRHSGSWAGYRAQFLRFPEQKFSVACLCNLSSANPSRMAQQVAEVFLGGLMKPEGLARSATAVAAPKHATAAAQLRGLSGAYLSRDTGRMVRVAASGGRLVVDSGAEKLTLAATGPGRFRVEEAPGAEVEFEAASGGRPVMRIATGDSDDRETEVFDPVAPVAPGALEIAELAGTYTSEELETTWRLAIEDGKLYIRHRGAPKEPLAPTATDVMSVDGLNLGFLRDAAGKVTGFTLDAGRVRGIAFRKV